MSYHLTSGMNTEELSAPLHCITAYRRLYKLDTCLSLINDTMTWAPDEKKRASQVEHVKKKFIYGNLI